MHALHPVPSCTPPHASAEVAPQLFCLHPGQHHALTVTAGSELFCTDGSVLLHSGPQGLIDGAPSLQWQLSTGQRWRAPCTLWLQVSAPNGAARLQCRMDPLPLEAQPPSTLWQRLRALRPVHWGREQRTAAGTST